MICSEGNSRPISLVDGNAPPRITGNSYYFTTPSGKTIVRHPSAYGWRTVYHHSTRRIEVGKNWNPKIPKGMELRTKSGAHLIRLSDGMGFHFDAKEILRQDFCTWARKEMARNYRKRLESNKLAKTFRLQVNNTLVNFDDARRAGNCAQGILDYAKRRLNLEKEELLIAPWLTKVPAKLLIRIDPHNVSVRNSINQAILREILICI